MILWPGLNLYSQRRKHTGAVIGVSETPAVDFPPHLVSVTLHVSYRVVASSTVSLVVPSAPSQPLPLPVSWSLF